MLARFVFLLIFLSSLIFNMSMSSGCDWRTANVTSIHKKGTKGDPGNYRPVSLTSIPCKIMESIVKDRMRSIFWRTT
jgi:hypothetical protein